MAAPNYGFVTLVSSDSYLPGALALAGALKDVHPSPVVPPEVDFQTVCLVTPETVDVSTIKLLRRAFDTVIGVEVIGPEDLKGLTLLGRLDLNTVLTKLHVFRLTQFSKIIFLDADVLPIRPLSHLFSLPHEFSASPDVGWPDIFNSGVLVLTPGEDKFTELTDLLKSKGSWDGGDQGILNEWRGGNWNRLSFTYNTTPTAAYTYAPAYERFGSQISAIHFIGPNKPWNGLAYRAPFSSQSVPPEDSRQQAYDYNSLVDRWYAVYDKHYRAETIVPQNQFETKRYESAWNDTRGERKAASASLPASSTLSLDDLRRLAIEGMNTAPRISRNDSPSGNTLVEGAYLSLPLEGRVDLMRPHIVAPQAGHSTQDNDATKEKKRPEVLHDLLEAEEPRTPLIHKISLPVDSSPRQDRLPTPGPNEIPPSPHPHTIALPPVTPTPQLSREYHHHPSRPESPSPDHRHLQSSEHPQHSHESHPPQPQSHERSSQPQNEPIQHNDPPRSRSPTMVLWNAAVDPPPTVTPIPSAFPTDTYFPNIWDAAPSKQNDHGRPPPADSGALFEPLPRTNIPEPLIRQGHYRNVTGEDSFGSTPSPDRTKVKHVFPWEEQPRHLPGRVFPVADSPKPSLFLSPESQASSSEVPTTPEPKQPTHAAAVLSPLYGLPTSFTYTNAWDTVPSIQKYASKLVRPPPPPSLAPAFDEDGWDRRSPKTWDEKAEASSRDGDVEDEGDDSIDEDAPAGSMWDDDSEPETTKSLQRRSRRGSSVSATRTIIETKKEYRNFGVQTIAREMRAQSVQATTPSPGKQDDGKDPETEKKPMMSGRRHWAPSSRPEVLPPVTMHAASTEPNPSPAPAMPSPAVSSPAMSPPAMSPPAVSLLAEPSPVVPSPIPETHRLEKPELLSPPSAVRPAHSFPPSPPGRRPQNKLATPIPKPISRTSSAQSPPAVVSRQVSNDSSLGSPASSVGPMSPPDGQPISPHMRKGGRVWDPARGVELFKRGSEEVLARFLKMGSWEDETR